MSTTDNTEKTYATQISVVGAWGGASNPRYMACDVCDNFYDALYSLECKEFHGRFVCGVCAKDKLPELWEKIDSMAVNIPAELKDKCTTVIEPDHDKHVQMYKACGCERCTADGEVPVLDHWLVLIPDAIRDMVMNEFGCCGRCASCKAVEPQAEFDAMKKGEESSSDNSSDSDDEAETVQE